MSFVYAVLWNLCVRRLNRRGLRVIVEGPFKPNPMKGAAVQQHPRRTWEPS